jgi:hypothetical protein
MKNTKLAKSVHEYYKFHIYEPMRARNQKIPRWRTRDILDHIENHTHDPTIWQGETISKYRKFSSIQEDMVISAKQDGGPPVLHFDKTQYRAMMDTDKMIAALYKMNPKEHLFHSETYKIDPTAIGRLVNIQKEFVFK